MFKQDAVNLLDNREKSTSLLTRNHVQRVDDYILILGQISAEPEYDQDHSIEDPDACWYILAIKKCHIEIVKTEEHGKHLGRCEAIDGVILLSFDLLTDLGSARQGLHTGIWMWLV